MDHKFYNVFNPLTSTYATNSAMCVYYYANSGRSNSALATQVFVSKLIGPLMSFLEQSVRPQNGFAYGRLGTTHRRMYSPYLGMLQLLQWFAYPIAIFQISRHERRINDTSNLREELLALLGDVERGRELDDGAVVCFSDGAWNGVPWHLLENP